MSDKAPTPAAEIRVGVRELRGKLSHFLEAARLGASVLATSRDDVIAEIRAPSAAVRAVRKPGALRGHIRMAEDFDTLPSDVLDAMER